MKTEYIKCRDCGINKKRIHGGKAVGGNTIYTDENGKRWNKRQCYSCSYIYSRAYARRMGQLPRSELKDYKNALGHGSELIVKSYFEEIGFSVSQTACHGPDLTLSMGPITLTCEVKSMTPHKNKGKNYYFCSPVYPKRQNDDLIAIVLPDGKIHVESMEDHLLKCAPAGQRQLTHLIRPMLYA